MAIKTDFTAEEWETLQKGVTGAGFWMTIADRSFFDTFKEAGALTKHLAQARQGAESELVRDLGETHRAVHRVRIERAEILDQLLGFEARLANRNVHQRGAIEAELGRAPDAGAVLAESLAVFEALVAPDRDGSRPWRLLLAGEQRPQILEAGRPNLIIWSSLWITRPDVRVR